MNGRERVAGALLVSLFVHLMVLLALGFGGRKAQPPPGAVSDRPRYVLPVHLFVPGAAEATAEVKAKASPAAAPQVAVAPPTSPPRDEGLGATSAAPPTVPSAPEAGGVRTAPGGGGGDGEAGGAGQVAALAELHRQLAAAARACYPPAARRFRLQGRVGLSFCVERSLPTQVALVGTTGQAALDDAARGCVLKGAGPLAVDEGCYVVPVEFTAR